MIGADLGTFERPPASFSEIMKVTVRTAYKATYWATEFADEIIAFQQGELEFAVSSLLIWATTSSARRVLRTRPIHRIKLSQWQFVLKDWLTQVRLLGRVDEEPGDQRELAWSLRKLMALSGRTKQEADWAKEKWERTHLACPKVALGPNGFFTYEEFIRQRDSTLKEVAAVAVKNLAWRPIFLKKWWKQRWRNWPKGSTSSHKEVKARLEGRSKSLDFEMRPTKKTLAETVSWQEFLTWLMSVPSCIARVSTKHEPGHKNRALFAQDDKGAAIAGFASDGVERNVQYAGMVIAQMPKDVQEWIGFEGSNLWRVSNDFSNFNILHSLDALASVSQHLAEAWLHYWKTTGDRQGVHRAYCETWTALSYRNCYTSGPAGYRVLCGLYSGHRNTARDNTILHLAYQRMIANAVAGLLNVATRPRRVRMSGDDETTSYQTWEEAVIYPLVADALGLKSKPEKGLLSMDNDEFLQLMRKRGGLPTYPVAHTILTYCSGNWYKDPVRDLPSTIPAIEDHCWSLVLGGVPQRVVRLLAADTLDYLMAIKPEGKLEEMEWWTFRGAGEGGNHPLWNVPGGRAPPKITMEGAGELRKLLANATDELMETEQQYWDLADPELQDRARMDRLRQSYAAVMRHELTRQYDQAAALAWPKRTTRAILDAPLYPLSIGRSVVIRARGVRKERDPPSVNAVCSRYSIPPEVFREKPGEVMAKVGPRGSIELLHALRSPERHVIKVWQLPGLLRTAIC